MPRRRLEDIGRVSVTFRKGIKAEELAWERLKPLIEAGGLRQYVRTLIVRDQVPEAFGARPTFHPMPEEEPDKDE